VNRQPVKELYTDSVEVMPLDYDWGQGYLEKWEYFEAAICEECGKPVVVWGEGRHRDIEEGTRCGGYVFTEGPMMNYYYPLPDFDHWPDPAQAAKRIADLPLCIIRFSDSGEYALALTAGGMDLSWEICEAYMCLGYLPPLHFCHLPSLAGIKLDQRTCWILAGCRRSAKVAAYRAREVKEKLRKLRKKLA
jgi:hypothetical protein